MNIERKLLAGCLAGAILLTGCSGGGTTTSSAPASDVGATEASVAGETLTLSVSGLSCPQCASNIDRTVGRIKGVRGVEVDLGAGEVRVSFYPNAAPNRAVIERAVRDAGFEVTG